MIRPAIAAVLLAACTSSPAPDRLLPGPCSARVEATDDIHAEYTYDAAGRLSTFAYDANQGVESASSEWTWSAAGVLERIDSRAACDLCEPDDSTWTFAPTGVTRVQRSSTPFTDTHEAELRFLGDPFEVNALAALRAPDSLLGHDSDDDPEDVTYTFTGAPREGTRTRTGTDGSVEMFSYDAEGRLASWAGRITYVYEGGRLAEERTEISTLVLERDAFGNLLRTVRDDGLVTTYDYGCW